MSERRRPGKDVRVDTQRATTLASLVLSNRESAESMARQILKEQAERQRLIEERRNVR